MRAEAFFLSGSPSQNPPLLSLPLPHSPIYTSQASTLLSFTTSNDHNPLYIFSEHHICIILHTFPQVTSILRPCLTSHYRQSAIPTNVHHSDRLIRAKVPERLTTDVGSALFKDIAKVLASGDLRQPGPFHNIMARRAEYLLTTLSLPNVNAKATYGEILTCLEHAGDAGFGIAEDM